tara:strand:+ start:346 stop:1266 length:921 start_codon:yes stop_codon:yes gene_type:complete
MIKRVALYLIILLINFDAQAVKKISIVKKINNEIITNIDVDSEIKYLKTLNPNTENLKKSQIREIAENSLVNEKIKIIELKRLTKLNYEDLPEEVLNNFILTIGINNLDEFKKHLLSKNLNINDVKKKIYIEWLWNSLIYTRYEKSIIINEDKIRQKVTNIAKNTEKEKRFFLYELIYNVENINKLKEKTLKIKESIENVGFESTVSIYSISETSKVGGKIGWVSQNQISEDLYQNIKNMNKGDITEPIKTLNGYMILFLKDIKIQEKKIDIEKEVKKMIDYEKNKKLKNFSLLHFNKVKIKQKIK